MSVSSASLTCITAQARTCGPPPHVDADPQVQLALARQLETALSDRARLLEQNRMLERQV
jgi:hypothetical protein